MLHDGRRKVALTSLELNGSYVKYFWTDDCYLKQNHLQTRKNKIQIKHKCVSSPKSTRQEIRKLNRPSLLSEETTKLFYHAYRIFAGSSRVTYTIRSDVYVFIFMLTMLTATVVSSFFTTCFVYMAIEVGRKEALKALDVFISSAPFVVLFLLVFL